MSVAENLAAIKSAIEKSARAVHRDHAAIDLIAVSKNQPPEKIAEALNAGQRFFGENRVQEAQSHWEDLRTRYPDLKLHLIGPLQTNKVKDAVKLFDVIHTIDREKLANALAEDMKKQSRALPCFIQVNTGAEDQKSGVGLNDLPALWNHCQKLSLNIIGLMCVPPSSEPPSMHFALLKKLAARHNLKNLSMGMSGDYLKAVEIGATHVRVGSAIFGARENPITQS